jgi:hypothetical protein
VSREVGSVEIVIQRIRDISIVTMTTWMIELDGLNVGTISNGQIVTVRSVPGRHTIAIVPKVPWYGRSKPVVFDVTEGQQVGIRVMTTTFRPMIGLPSLGAPGPRESAAATPGTIMEGSRYTVPLGDEVRVMDNSRSSSPAMRVVRLTREWVRTCTVDTEHISMIHGSAGVGIRVLELKIEAERTLMKKYSTTTEHRETFQEEVTITVAPRTKSTIVFSWKEIRQRGVVQVAAGRSEARIPYEIVTGLTFDQQQTDDLL